MDDATFCKMLPKAELHAHLTGSISPDLLHELWLERFINDPGFDLGDPLVILDEARKGMGVDTFFPLFSDFIYRLCDSKPIVQRCTARVLSEFHADGVQYLELRTIPRASEDPSADLPTKESYVKAILKTIRTSTDRPNRTYLILSIDRKGTAQEALETVDLAIKYKWHGVVGVDLAGNPAKGDVAIFSEAFAKAKAAGLKITLHFAEVESSSQDEELRTLLSFQPDRLGHAIRVPDWAKEEIRKRRIGLELCLTCNVDAKLISGGFAAHHFGYWRDKECPIAICTDDVGIFRSRTSEEYLLLMKHFGLSREDLIDLCWNSVSCIFGPELDQCLLAESVNSFEHTHYPHKS